MADFIGGRDAGGRGVGEGKGGGGLRDSKGEDYQLRAVPLLSDCPLTGIPLAHFQSKSRGVGASLARNQCMSEGWQGGGDHNYTHLRLGPQRSKIIAD